MKTEYVLDSVIARVTRMEGYFDAVQKALHDNPASLNRDSRIGEMLAALTDYYENGQWLKDYECDERGELPHELKRGVLSQDGVYNLINEVLAITDFIDE